MARFTNRDAYMAALKRIPASVQKHVQDQGDKDAPGLAEAIKRAAPVGGPHDPSPGHLRDSVHDERGQKPMSWKIVIDAKDAKGRFMARSVEFGHRAHNGVHVPPRPFAYPTFRAQWPPIRRRLAAAGRAGAREAAPFLKTR